MLCFSTSKSKENHSETPKMIEGSFTGGMLHMDMGNFDEAIVMFEKGIQMDPGDARFYAAMGSCHERKGQWEKAEAMYRQMLKLSPGTPPVYVCLAETLKKQGKFEEAVRVLDHLMYNVGEYAPALLCLGEMYLERGEHVKALSFLQRAVEKEENSETMSGLAQALLYTGDLKEAEKLLKKVTEGDSAKERDWCSEGVVKYALGKGEEAVAAFTMAIAMSGKPEYHMQRAAALIMTQKPHEALLDLDFARKEMKESLMITLLRGHALDMIGDAEGAWKLYKTWLEQTKPEDTTKEQLDQVWQSLKKCVNAHNPANKQSLLRKLQSIVESKF